MRATVSQLEDAIAAEAVIGTGALFRDGIARFTVSNTGTVPLQVVGHFSAGRDIEPLVDEVERTVPAGGVAVVEVAYHAPDAPVPYERIAPAPVEWTLRTREGEVPLEIETRATVHPERRFEIVAAPSPVTVDGDLGDWSALPFVVDEPGGVDGHGRYTGPTDASFRFGLAYDDEHLYLAIDVTDDSIVAGTDRVAREQDNVGISIDARPDPERSQNAGVFEAIASGAYGKITSAVATLEEPKEDALYQLFGLSPLDGVVQAARRTERGYAVEISVPASALDEARGAAWDTIRANVSVTDFDAEEPDHSVIYWRASRFGDNALEGSGTFLRR